MAVSSPPPAPLRVRFYLPDAMRDSAAEGRHNFIGKVTEVLERAGFDVRFLDDSLTAQMSASTRDEYSVFHMVEPTHASGVTIRRNYFYPFWKIEAKAKRWTWPVAKTSFDPAIAPKKEAARFAGFWREKLFDGKAQAPTRDGFIYCPLQGRLSQHRGFQSCSPLAMVERLALARPATPIVATLHPSETYQPQELTALNILCEQHPNLSLGTASMADYLHNCDLVVTQNSSAAFMGYFFGKPAVLFARIDFHHIAARVERLGVKAALEQAEQANPNYDAYLWWFLQDQSINAGRPEAHDKIAATLRRHNWPV